MTIVIWVMFNCIQGGGDWNLVFQHLGDQVNMSMGDSLAGPGDINQDGFTDLIIGASIADPNGIVNAGSVIVQSGKDGRVLARLDGIDENRRFGYAVSEIGDLNNDGHADFLVSAPGFFHHIGRVFLYSGLDQSLILEKSGSMVEEQFGAAINGGNDINNDTHPDFVVSSPKSDPLGTQDAGSVFVFSGLNGATIHQIDGATTNASFGRQVAALGDLDGDNYDDFAFGSWYAGSRGSLHAYSGRTGTELWRVDGSDSGDALGGSIAGLNDINGDGFDDVIVGATQSGGLSWPPGYIQVLSGNDGTEIFRINGNKSGDEFGDTVASIGDINGDGKSDFAVGANNAYDPIYGLVGAVYFYSGVNGSRLKKFTGDTIDDCIGRAIATMGDINADGRPEIAFGDHCTDVSGFDSGGAVYVYSYDPFLTPSGTSISDTTGGSITYEHHFALSEAGMNYWLLASTAREGTFIKNGVEIPLANTGLLHRSANNPMPFVQNAAGVLDQNAQATSVLTWAPGKANAYVGRIFALASVTYDNSSKIRLSSGKALLRVLP